MKRIFESKLSRFYCRDITLGKENNPIPGVNAVDEEENPTDYLYITENCETTPLNINRTITSLQVSDFWSKGVGCLCKRVNDYILKYLVGSSSDQVRDRASQDQLRLNVVYVSVINEVYLIMNLLNKWSNVIFEPGKTFMIAEL